jgi:hypothetical protein
MDYNHNARLDNQFAMRQACAKDCTDSVIAKDGNDVIKVAANNGHAAVLEILIHKAHEHDSALATPVYRESIVAAAVRSNLPVVDLLLKMKDVDIGWCNEAVFPLL